MNVAAEPEIELPVRSLMVDTRRISLGDLKRASRDPLEQVKILAEGKSNIAVAAFNSSI